MRSLDRARATGYGCTARDAEQGPAETSAPGEEAMATILRATAILFVLPISLSLFALSEARAQTGGTPNREAAIEDLVVANHVLADQGVLDAFGHVSVRDPANPNHFLMSRNMPPALVTKADIVEYDFDGKAINPPPNVSHFLERFIHGEAYRARSDVNAVVHSHSPAVIPFGVSKVSLQPLYHMAAFLSPTVPVFDIRQVAGMTNMLVSNSALGKDLMKTLGDRNVALMRGHGDVVVAGTLPMAVFRAVYTETDARLQLQAVGLGGPVTYLAPEESAKAMAVLDQIHSRAWQLWKQAALEKMKTQH